jgi:hypothetical protein
VEYTQKLWTRRKMSKQRVISTKFWDDTYIINLDPIEKLLFLYFLTNPLTNICGVYEISLRRVALDTGIDKDMILKILDRFERDDKMIYFDGWLAVKNFVKNQNLNPSVKEGIKREFDGLPKPIKDRLGTGWGEAVVLNLTKLNLTKPIFEKEEIKQLRKLPTIEELRKR